MSQPALDQAIRLYLLPASAAALRTAPLPSDIHTLLLILARDPEAEVDAVKRVGRPIGIIREAAEFYAVQILFAPQASAYRSLAAEPGASRESLRANMALLLRWLHPDCGFTEARPSYFDRVVLSWDTLGSPERRAHYDRTSARQAASRRMLSQPGRHVAPFFATDRRSRLASSIAATLAAPRTRWGPAILGLAILIGVASAWVIKDRLDTGEQAQATVTRGGSDRDVGNAIGPDGRRIRQREATYDAADWR